MVLTFLFTDIEGSTRLWETRRAEMEAALAAHDRALKRAVEQRRGNVFKTVGDAIFANFPSAADAILAAIDCQCAIAALEAPLALKIRVAVHSGDAEARDNDFFGPVMNRTARLLATAHGTQVVVSSAAYELARDALPSEVEVIDLGEHRLKDLTRPERIFQIRHSTFVSSNKPPASLSQAKHNLPIQTTRFIGRESQLHEVQQAIREFRLVTLCGPGGAGKTRLGLQTASEAIDDFPDGVWLAELAPLREPSGVLGSVLDTL